MTVVVADMGATNARLAYITNRKISDIYCFACDDFKSPAHLIESFVHWYAQDTKSLLLGVPGTVLQNKVKWTNKNWTLDAQKLQQKLGMKHVVLMNDLEVQGAALPLLHKKDLVFLQKTKQYRQKKHSYS